MKNTFTIKYDEALKMANNFRDIIDKKLNIVSESK